MIELAAIQLPDFGIEHDFPEIPLDLYRARLSAAGERMRRDGLDCLVVYGDREHCANLAYLTGFDPRFEEALLLLAADGRAQLIVGNECMGYLPDEGLGLDVVLFQDFSLMGQPRGDSRPLRAILADFGIGPKSAVGCVGWKYYDSGLVEGGAAACDAPAYLVDLLRDLVGARERVRNATALFANPIDGLRTTNEPEQIAQFEFAAIRTSEGVRRVLAQFREGVEERELEPLLDGAGLPLSCHRMIGFGEKVRRGLASPSANRARLGDPFTVALGVAGALSSRAGWIARGPEDLPAGDRDFCMRFAANYFDVVAAWYEAIRVGVTAGEVYRAAEARRDPALARFAVNPGHLLHLDEWLHSPFASGSPLPLRSGMAIQMDIIPVSVGPFCYVNAEDGIALADARLRAEIAVRFPGCWRRIEARRRFMGDALGIRLHESVLPLGNTSGWLPPFGLDLGRAYRVAE